MRNNGILNIDVARADLPMQPEYWIEETYVSRYEKLLRVTLIPQHFDLTLFIST